MDHLCHTRSCVNPSHLRAVTPQQNQQNLRGAHMDSLSGVRGVYWKSAEGCWGTEVRHAGRRYTKRFADFDEACAHVVNLRNELYTHNDADRGATDSGHANHRADA